MKLFRESLRPTSLRAVTVAVAARMRVALAVLGAAGVILGAGIKPAQAMNKAELIDDLAARSGLSKADAKRALDSFFDVTTSALKKGDRIALVGFGSFSISKGAVTDPGDPGATLPGGKRLKPLKVRHRSGNRAAGTLTLGENGTWELVLGMPDASFYDETLELEVKMPKPFDPRRVELSLRLPPNAAGSSVRAVLDAASADGSGAVVEITLPADAFDDFAYDAATPEPDYHGAFYRSVHADVATDPCAEAVLGDRLGFDGDILCAPCTFDASMRDQVIAGMQVATGLDPASLSSFLDAMQALSYGPPLRDATSLSGLGSVSVSKRAARTGRNPQTGKEIKIAAKKVVKFKAGAELASKVN